MVTVRSTPSDQKEEEEEEEEEEKKRLKCKLHHSSLNKIHFNYLTLLSFNSVFQVSNLFNSIFSSNFIKKKKIHMKIIYKINENNL